MCSTNFHVDQVKLKLSFFLLILNETLTSLIGAVLFTEKHRKTPKNFRKTPKNTEKQPKSTEKQQKNTEKH